MKYFNFTVNNTIQKVTKKFLKNIKKNNNFKKYYKYNIIKI